MMETIWNILGTGGVIGTMVIGLIFITFCVFIFKTLRVVITYPTKVLGLLGAIVTLAFMSWGVAELVVFLCV